MTTTVEEVEEVLDTVIRVNVVKSFITANKHVVVAVAVGLAVGGAVHILTKRHLESKYEDQAAADIKSVKEHYSSLYDAAPPKPASPQEMVETLRYVSPGPGQAEVPIVFDLKEPATEVDELIDDNVWDQDAENLGRDPQRPYIVSVSEFENDVTGYQQVTFSYFEGDEVLTDERSVMVTDVDNLVGELNLYKFGHGSGDPNILYVRNEKIEMEFEITRSSGKYSEEVLGFIEHSEADDRIRRFRQHRE